MTHQIASASQQRLNQIGDGLDAVRKAVRAEKKLHGRVLPETAKLLVERMAEAEAYLAIDKASMPVAA